jgi:hypothetical protein
VQSIEDIQIKHCAARLIPNRSNPHPSKRCQTVKIDGNAEISSL